MTIPHFIFFQIKERTQACKIISSTFLCVFIVMVSPACAFSYYPTYEDLNFSYNDSSYFSYTNLSINEVTKWRDEISGISYTSPLKESGFRHYTVFFPDIPEDAKPAGYYIQILPDGVSASYTELIDAETPAPSKDEFLFRAEEWLNSEEDTVTKIIQDRFQAEILFNEGYSEMARHTTVRKYQDIGEITTTTIVYQYLNDGDPERDYFCIASYTEMTPEDEIVNRTGWKNSKFRVNYDYNVKYNSLKPFEVDSSISSPQTSPRYLTYRGDLSGGILNTFDIFGLLSGMFGHSISLHSTGAYYPDVSWITECGYFTESASDSLNLVSISEIMPKQFSADEDSWHVLAKTGIDANSGWSGIGGLVKRPSPSSEWGSYIMIH